MAFVDTELRPAGEVQQKVGRLKVSEAIRIGARIRPQCYGRYFRDGGSCALGAAYEAMTGRTFDADWSAQKQSDAECWMREQFGHNFHGIWLMNDDRKESRESIATWLESQGL